MKGFAWVKSSSPAEQRINKALQAGGIEDFYGFLNLLNTQTRMNGRNRTRVNAEDLLITIRGRGLKHQDASIRQVIYNPLGGHGQKPAKARYRLGQLYGDVSRIELFNRYASPGWHRWGNQVENPNVVISPSYVGRPDPLLEVDYAGR